MSNASFNSICQAVKVLLPSITREAHRSICGYPNCMTATNRYWRETYNIRPWDDRCEKEHLEALAEARKLINAAVEKGVRCPKIDRLICNGAISKPNKAQLSIAGYKYHHTANRQGYTCVDSIGAVIPYKGRFGKGFIMLRGRGGVNGDSTRYELISYWVK